MPDNTSEIVERPFPQDGSVWKHYKGREYKVICIACVEASIDQSVVIYQAVGGGVIWSRPYDEFMGTVEVTEDGHSGHIFRFVQVA